MHGQQTMKFLNDKAVADSILAKYKAEGNIANPVFEKAVQEALAAKAKAVAAE